MKIIPVVFKDLKLIIEEYIYYFNHFEEMTWSKKTVSRRLKELSNRYDYIGLGIFDNEKIIGFAIGNLSQFDDGLIAILNELFIISAFQSKGYGTQLLKAFENYAKENGAFRIQLETSNDEIHQRFYNKYNDYFDTNNNILKAKSL